MGDRQPGPLEKAMKTALFLLCAAICITGTMANANYVVSVKGDKTCTTAANTTDALCNVQKNLCDTCPGASGCSKGTTCKSTSQCAFTYTGPSSMTTAECESAKKALKDAGTKVDGECTAML